MYNRYDGNTGRFVRMPEPEYPAQERPAIRRPPPPPPQTVTYPRQTRPQAAPGTWAARPAGPEKMLPDSISGLLGKLVPNIFRDGLEPEDLMLMLILYLMYRESGDKELLIILGAMLFL